MRVIGVVKGKHIHIFLDTGSTHNILDMRLMKTFGKEVEKIGSQEVTVVNESIILCHHRCKEFCWEMGGDLFTTDVLFISLEACDMVLGVQWFKTLGQIIWDFENLKIEFEWQGKMKILQGISSCRLHVREELPSNKMVYSSAQLYLNSISEPTCQPTNTNPPFYSELQALRETYQTLFT